MHLNFNIKKNQAARKQKAIELLNLGTLLKWHFIFGIEEKYLQSGIIHEFIHFNLFKEYFKYLM